MTGRFYAIESTPRGLLIAGSRGMLYSEVAADMLRKQLVHQLGDELARAIVAQAGRQAGFHDAQLMLQEQTFQSVDEMLRTQYHLLTACGFGSFDVIGLEANPTTGEVYVRVRARGSPEAESHRRLFGVASLPACWHLVGYSTGWASAMTRTRVLTIESRCLAKGDSACEFETLPYDDFVGPEATFWRRAFESSSTSLAEELRVQLDTVRTQMETIQAQRTALAALGAPILQVADDVIAMPIVGAIDVQRAQAMGEKLLREVGRVGARGAILDVTGVEGLDAATCAQLFGIARAVTLLGAGIVVTGVSPSMAAELVGAGVDFRSIVTRHALHDGIRHFTRREA